jgi:large subunit ribosomal protein L25
MEQKTLTAVERKRLGKGESGRLRRQGKIPGIIYGHTQPKPIAVDAHEFDSKFRHISESTIIELRVEEQAHEVLIRDFQEDAVSGRVTHIDFYEVEKGKLLRTNVAVSLKGAAVGVREGGLLETFIHEIEVECLPKDLPERIEVEVGDLALGHSIYVRQLAIPEGIRVLNSPDQVVCAVVHKRIEEEKPVEAAPVAAEEEVAAEETAEAPAEE